MREVRQANQLLREGIFDNRNGRAQQAGLKPGSRKRLLNRKAHRAGQVRRQNGDLPGRRAFPGQSADDVGSLREHLGEKTGGFFGQAQRFHQLVSRGRRLLFGEVMLKGTLESLHLFLGVLLAENKRAPGCLFKALG